MASAIGCQSFKPGAGYYLVFNENNFFAVLLLVGESYSASISLRPINETGLEGLLALFFVKFSNYVDRRFGTG